MSQSATIDEFTDVQGTTEQGTTEQGTTEQGTTEQGTTEQGTTEQGTTEQTIEVESEPPIVIQVEEPPPNPTVELMKQHSKIALLIGLDYGILQNRVQSVTNAKQILIDMYNYTEENIIMLIEPSREDLTNTLNTVIGSSGLVNEIIIYYAGYGNGINPDLTKEEGVIDNLAKVMVPADLSKIDVTNLLVQSCCKTLCIMDMCPYQDDEMLLKWGADITGNVKVVTFCESDSKGTRRSLMIPYFSFLSF